MSAGGPGRPRADLGVERRPGERVLDVVGLDGGAHERDVGVAGLEQLTGVHAGSSHAVS